MKSVSRALAVAAVSLGGCINTFDPALYASAGDAGAASDAGPPIFALADYCTGEAVPEIVLPDGATSMSVAIDARALADNGSSELTCARRAPTGPDGFASVRMAPNDRWHFHFRHVENANPVLYVLPSCDVRLCTEVVADSCDGGADEHLTVEAGAAGGTFLLGVDTADAAGLTGSLEIIRPVCGNGVLEHSETCDDRDLDAGDGCDESCRAELGVGGRTEEQNPNDDRFSANHVIGAGPVLVSGRVATSCEIDWFMVDVPEGGAIAAQLLTATGATCTSGRPANLLLDLYRETGSLPIASGVEAGGGACAAIDATTAGASALPAGRYFLRVYALNVGLDRPFDYGLRITITP